MPPLFLLADQSAAAVWAHPIGRAWDRAVLPSRVSNLRKRRDRIRACLRRAEEGGTLDHRQAEAVKALGDIDRELAAWELEAKKMWADRATRLIAATGATKRAMATDSPGPSPADGLAAFSRAFGHDDDAAVCACAFDTCLAVVGDVVFGERYRGEPKGCGVIGHATDL